jgi:Outer membrane protein beta-barrel domain
MRMKKSFINTFLLIVVMQVNAQKNQLYLKGGLNIAKFSSVNAANFSEVNSLISFNAGVLAKIPLSNKIALQPALLFNGKGAKTKGGNAPFTYDYFKATTNPCYLELPVNIVFDVQLKEKNSLFFGAGFYGALGIAGKNKVSGSTAIAGRYGGEKKIDFSKNQGASPDFHDYAGIGYMNREDYGITVTAGMHFKKLLFSLDYQYGLNNIDRGSRSARDENKNRVLGLSIGYRLF